MSDNILIVLDVETTGLDHTKEKIIEFAGLKLVNGEITEEFETLINPEQHIRYSSINIHGITEEMVADAPKTAEIMPRIFEFMGDYPIVAHNAIFDYNFLNQTSWHLYEKPINNHYFDSQQMFREVCPEEKSHGLDALMKRFEIEPQGIKHRAMADAKGLALAYPLLEKLYYEKNDWQMSQMGNVDYLFERFIRIQNAIQIMQSELGDIKSIFKVYFEQGGAPVTATTGEVLSYQSKTSFSYDFAQIKDVLDEIGSLEKVTRLNNGLLDRILTSNSLSEEQKEKLRAGRCEVCENRNIHIQKPDKK
ncbi:MAG: 3'-5' exonuclease [Candidatus Gastranaerophilales bacterium]|nr:3'-5' exonuclease [Candidatus Gastranaerophilales bacterium]